MVAFGFVDPNGAVGLMNEPEQGRSSRIGRRDHIESQGLRYLKHRALAAVFRASERNVRIGREHGIEVGSHHPERENLAVHRRLEVNVFGVELVQIPKNYIRRDRLAAQEFLNAAVRPAHQECATFWNRA